MSALFDTARQAIRARIEANWTATPLSRIAWPNEDFAKPLDDQGNAQSFLYVEVFNDSTELTTVGIPGQRRVTQSGRIVAHAFVPLNAGLDAAGTLRGAVATIFEEQLFSNVRCWLSKEEEGGTTDDTGAYFRTSVTIAFDFYRLV